MTTKELLASADNNLAATRHQVRRSPESVALDNLIAAVRQLDAKVDAQAAAKPAKAAKK